MGDKRNFEKYSFTHVVAEMCGKCSEGREVQAMKSSWEHHRKGGTSSGP